MSGKIHQVIALEKRQGQLKKEIKQIKKRMPYYIIGFFFFSILIIGLFEGKLEKLVGGDSINFIIIVGIVCCISCLIYLIALTKKITSKKKEDKEIDNKLYDLLKLEESNLHE